MIQVYPDSFHELQYVTKTKKVAFIGFDNTALIDAKEFPSEVGFFFEYDLLQGIHVLDQIPNKKSIRGVFLPLERCMKDDFKAVKAIRELPKFDNTPIILIRQRSSSPCSNQMLQSFGVDDCIDADIFGEIDLLKLLDWHNHSASTFTKKGIVYTEKKAFKIPLGKRIFDVAFASSLLVVLAPVLLTVAAAIKLTSKGPVIYKSKRAGAGYKIFDFLKFRSMCVDADKKLKKLAEEQNQYDDNTFVKINKDPRITKIGHFIRKTSLDELPQLINVLKGDMSIVGNRPLPIYEAQTLTKDEWVARFNAPAGLTGLWQVTKRGKADMSTEERIQLDIDYANSYSLTMDLKILFMTFPALIQQEAV